MVELWFYSGRLGNCMFAYAFNRCIADTLNMQLLIPKGTEINGFPEINKHSVDVNQNEEKYIVYPEYRKNNKTILNENDNMVWLIEKQFNGAKLECYQDCLIIPNILNIPNIDSKWIVTLGNFETGEQYLPYRDKIKQWFQFPNINLDKIEFFKIHSDLGNPNCYIRVPFTEISKNDLLISLRLEDYTFSNNIDRLLVYDYFKIIINSREWNNIYILTNPSSIGPADNQYNLIKEFYPHNPILVRCYEPVLSMAFGSQFNNIALSQSTYSWWMSFLSKADNIYYPIPKEGPFSLDDPRYKGTDLRLGIPEFKYVDYNKRTILPNSYFNKIDYNNSKWKD